MAIVSHHPKKPVYPSSVAASRPTPPREVTMKASHWIIAAAALAFVQPAQAGINDPEVIIYRISGVADSGGAPQTGLATAFHCTNFSGVLENTRVVVRNAAGALLANTPLAVAHLHTVTWTTRDTALFSEDAVMVATPIQQGTAAIAATSVNVLCTAMLLDASKSFEPQGIKLHMLRFNPIPGTQE